MLGQMLNAIRMYMSHAAGTRTIENQRRNDGNSGSVVERRRNDRRRNLGRATLPQAPQPYEPPTVPDGYRHRSLATVEWLTALEAANYLGLPSRKALYQAVRRGQVPVHRLGRRRLRFRRAELDQLLQRGRQPALLDSF